MRNYNSRTNEAIIYDIRHYEHLRGKGKPEKLGVRVMSVSDIARFTGSTPIDFEDDSSLINAMSKGNDWRLGDGRRNSGTSC